MASNLVTNLQQNPSVMPSVSVQGAYEPFDLQVSRNQIAGHSTISIFGFNGNITSSTAPITAPIPMWENATAYTFPATAATLTVVSTATSDNTAASVLITGLDANYNIISETLFLNGTTAVTSVNSYLRVNGVSLVSTGTSQVTNVGTITFKQGTNIVAQINPKVGKNQNSIYTVPNGYTFYLELVEVNSDNTLGSGNGMYYNVQQTINGVQQNLLTQGFSSVYVIDRHFAPIAFPQKTDIQWQIATSSASAILSGAIIIGILIKNDGQTA